MIRANSIESSKISIEYEHNMHGDFIEIDRALRKIKTGKIGSRLLDKISSLSFVGRGITIQVSKKKTNSIPHLTAQQLKDCNVTDDKITTLNIETASKLAIRESHGGHGVGVSSLIKWNPSFAIDIDENGYGVKNPESSNGFMSLVDELIQSMRYLSGNTLATDTRDMYQENSLSRIEKNIVIGIAGHEDEELTENKIRAEHGLPQRISWYSIDKVDNSQLIQFMKDNNLIKETLHET